MRMYNCPVCGERAYNIGCVSLNTTYFCFDCSIEFTVKDRAVAKAFEVDRNGDRYSIYVPERHVCNTKNPIDAEGLIEEFRSLRKEKLANAFEKVAAKRGVKAETIRRYYYRYRINRYV